MRPPNLVNHVEDQWLAFLCPVSSDAEIHLVRIGIRIEPKRQTQDRVFWCLRDAAEEVGCHDCQPEWFRERRIRVVSSLL